MLAAGQTGPGLWDYNLREALPRLPVALKVNDALLLVVGVAGCQQLGGQIWRTLFTAPSVCGLHLMALTSPWHCITWDQLHA